MKFLVEQTLVRQQTDALLRQSREARSWLDQAESHRSPHIVMESRQFDNNEKRDEVSHRHEHLPTHKSAARK